jgi:hypothetical protein
MKILHSPFFIPQKIIRKPGASMGDLMGDRPKITMTYHLILGKDEFS